MKLALRDLMTPGETLTDRLAWLERAGFDGIELEDRSLADLRPDELREIFDASPVAAVNVPGSGALLDPDPRERAAAKDLTRRRLELAGELGAVGVLVVPQFGRNHCCRICSHKSRSSWSGNCSYCSSRNSPAPAAANAGVPIFLEPLNRYEQHLVNRLEQGVAFAEQVGQGIKIMADFFHMSIEEASIAAIFARRPRTSSTCTSPTATACSPGEATWISAPASPR